MFPVHRALPSTDNRNKFTDYLQNDHKCSIDSDDVLEALFKRKGLLVGLQRWWYNLFLVSYSNQEARLFYLGTFAIRSHRRRHYLSSRYIIHPWSKYRAIWNCIMMLSVVFSTFIFTHTTSPVFSQDAGSYLPFLVFSESVVLLDILLHFQSGYVDTATKTVVLERNKILKHYVSTTIFMDVLTAIPLQVILIVGSLQNDLESECLNSVFVCLLRVLNMFRMVRLWKMTDCWKLGQRQTLASSSWYVKVLKTLILCIGTMLQVSNLGDTITLLEAHYTGYLNPKSFLAFMLIQKHLIKIPSVNLVFLNMSRLFKKFVISHHGFYINRRPIDRITDITNYFLGAFFAIWCLLEMTTYLHRRNYSYNRKSASLDEAKRFVQSRRVADRLKDRIHKYYNYVGVHNVWQPRRNEMFTTLPESIRIQIAIETRSNLLSNVQLFSNWPPHIVEKMTLALDMQIYLEGDTVCSNLIINDCMVIVVRGILAIYSLEGAEKGRLTDGQHFGEICLVTEEDMARGPNIAAVTDSYVALLHKSDFRNIMNGYSSLYDSLRNELLLTLNQPKMIT